MRHIVKLAACGAALGVPARAGAFCGLYVAEPGTTIENHGSEVIWAHHDGRVTITIGADFEGDASEFGLLIPVPQELGRDDIRTADPALFDYMDQYTTPRLVEYTCDDFAAGGHRGGYGGGCAEYDLAAETDDAGGMAPRADDGVTVQERFTLGEYDIAILDTDDADSLTAWLDLNGFAAPTDRDGIVQGYVDNGTNFMAARVILDAVPDGRNWLSPVQFSYDAPIGFLPIRIGTLAATGMQEVVIYAITDAADGELHIANYPEVTVEDECMWTRDGDGTLDTFYRAQLDAAFAGQAAWAVEYSIPVIGQASCDPCTTDAPLFVSDLAQYGWDGAEAYYGGGYTSGAAHLTRLRVRYTPEQALDDLRFEAAGPLPMSQIRYIDHVEGLESMFPVCGVGMVEDPGTCDLTLDAAPAAVACATPRGSTAGVGAAAILGLVLRRRRR